MKASQKPITLMIYALNAVKRSETKPETGLLGREAGTYNLAKVAKVKKKSWTFFVF